jgi:hypothetical protein
MYLFFLVNKSYACMQMLNCHATSSQNVERESAYDIVKEKYSKQFSFWTRFGSVANELLHVQIAALMKIPFLDDEEMPSPNQPLPPKVLGIVICDHVHLPQKPVPFFMLLPQSHLPFML